MPNTSSLLGGGNVVNARIGIASTHDDAPVLVEGRGSIVDFPGDLGGKEPSVVQWQVDPALVKWLKNAATATHIRPIS